MMMAGHKTKRIPNIYKKIQQRKRRSAMRDTVSLHKPSHEQGLTMRGVLRAGFTPNYSLFPPERAPPNIRHLGDIRLLVVRGIPDAAAQALRPAVMSLLYDHVWLRVCTDDFTDPATRVDVASKRELMDRVAVLYGPLSRAERATLDRCRAALAARLERPHDPPPPPALLRPEDIDRFVRTQNPGNPAAQLAIRRVMDVLRTTTHAFFPDPERGLWLRRLIGQVLAFFVPLLPEERATLVEWRQRLLREEYDVRRMREQLEHSRMQREDEQIKRQRL